VVPLAQALRQTFREATVLLLWPRQWTRTCKEMAKLADRMFWVYGESTAARGRAKAEEWVQGLARKK
jgi:hypothetical protein